MIKISEMDFRTDDAADIEKCLNCELPECTNCLQYGGEGGHLSPDPPIPEYALSSESSVPFGVYQCYLAGFTDRETADTLNVRSSYVLQLRRLMGLKGFSKTEREIRRKLFEAGVST